MDFTVERSEGSPAKALQIGGKILSHTEKLPPQYKQFLVKALPHLEKAQACDPNEDTLIALQYIYQSLKTPEKITTLDNRLKALSVNCISLIKDD